MTKRNKKGKRRHKRVWTTIFITLAIIGIFSIWSYWRIFRKCNISENAPEDLTVKIYRSYGYDDLRTAIDTSGIIADGRTFDMAAAAMKLKENFKPGLYKLKRSMNNTAIIRTISHGWQTPVQVTFNGYTRRFPKLAATLGKQFEADSASFASVLLDESIAVKYGFKPETFIGMFIPNTYEVYWTMTPEEFLDRMKKEYDLFWDEERTTKAKNSGLSKDEVSTLASIVIEETKYEPEMARIAGVYMNRLHKGMLLQADPTVKYATEDDKLRRILSSHLKIDSPYNTYKHKGLPPGPITMPPAHAIDAVLNYEHHNYIYFCAKPTFNGQHSFAVSYSEHLKNARAYQRAFAEREKSRARKQ